MSQPIASIPYVPLVVPVEERAERGRRFHETMDARRSVREFSDRPVPREVIEQAIRTACTAPSGAHQQPWTWVAVSDPEIKRQIRKAAEAEEKAFYEQRAPAEWLEALQPLGTDWEKPFLEVAPWLVILFAQRYGVGPDGSRTKHYYVPESCGISAGLFIGSLQEMGLATLTHTPSPMGFLKEVLKRPANEAAMILFPVGYPASGVEVPDLHRKRLEEVSEWFEADR